MLNLKKLLTRILLRDIRTEKQTVSVPAISGGGYASIAVTAPTTDPDETVIGWRLIAMDAAQQLTLAYVSGWKLNVSNEYSGTSGATTAEIWWIIQRRPH